MTPPFDPSTRSRPAHGPAGPRAVLTRGSRLAAVGAAAWLGLASSCAEPTQITLSLATDVPAGAARSLAIYEQLDGQPQLAPLTSVEARWAESGDVGSLVLVPRESRSGLVSIVVVLGVDRPASACDVASGEGCIVARRRLSFAAGRSLALRVALRQACLGVPCDESSTCSALGLCVAATIDPSACRDGVCVLEGDGADLADPAAIAELAAGSHHACVRYGDGRIKCWGRNDSGQLGLGDTRARGARLGEMGAGLPLVDTGGRRVVALALGEAHTCALTGEGDVLCWGANERGQLGQGDTRSRGDTRETAGSALRPVPLLGGAKADAIHAGRRHTCARTRPDRRVLCWGHNDHGQRGAEGSDPVGVDAATLAAIGTTAFDAIDRFVPGSPGADATCTLSASELRCVGYDFAGALGDGERVLPMGVRPPPIDLGPSFAVSQAARGLQHACALARDGPVKCWGDGGFGQTGHGDTRVTGDTRASMGDALPTIALPAGARPVAVAASDYASFVRLDDGSVVAFGQGHMLGVGPSPDVGGTRASVDAGLPRVALGDMRARAVVAGRNFACAHDGRRVMCWGEAADGVLGEGVAGKALTPVAVDLTR